MKINKHQESTFQQLYNFFNETKQSFLRSIDSTLILLRIEFNKITNLVSATQFPLKGYCLALVRE